VGMTVLPVISIEKRIRKRREECTGGSRSSVHP